MRAELGAVGDVWILHTKEKDQFDEDKRIRSHVRERDKSDLLASHLDEIGG